MFKFGRINNSVHSFNLAGQHMALCTVSRIYLLLGHGKATLTNLVTVLAWTAGIAVCNFVNWPLIVFIYILFQFLRLS